MENYPQTAHTNKVTLDSLSASASATPAVGQFKKSLDTDNVFTVTEENGVSLPAWKFRLDFAGVTGDINVDDTFDTSLFKIVPNGANTDADTWWMNTVSGGGGSLDDWADDRKADALAITEIMGTGAHFHVKASDLPKNNGAYYPHYRIIYYLQVKDADALAKLNQEAAAASDATVTKNNTASYAGASSEVSFNYKYEGLKKTAAVQNVNGVNDINYTVQINPGAVTLNNGNPMTLQDTFDNTKLSIDLSSISISPQDKGAKADVSGGMLTVKNIPDHTALKLTYKGRVLGNGNLKVENTATMGNYSSSTSSSVTQTSGSGGASVASIYILKYEAGNIDQKLSGATFKLYTAYNSAMDNEPVLIDGKPLTVTTGTDGTALIESNSKKKFYLEKGKTYYLREIKAPDGYALSDTTYQFTLSKDGTVDYAKHIYYSGDTLSVKDVRSIRIPVSKTWDDSNSTARPASVTLQLQRSMDNKTWTDVIGINGTVTLRASNSWKAEFSSLPATDTINGEDVPVYYRVVETNVPAGYTVSYDKESISSEDSNAVAKGFKVTNRLTTPETTEVTVTKDWEDRGNQDGKRPNFVTVQLYSNDKPEGEAVELSESNQWTYTWSKLAAKKAGKDITYTVKETSELPEGYTSEVSGSAKEGFTITNSHTPETIEISGTKTWDDNNNQDGARPDSITVRLKADGAEKDSQIVTSENGWKYSFTDLPKYAAGKEISYSVTEDAVTDYITVYEGLDITNTHTPGETSVTVTKAWNDSENQDGKRPNSVKVQLYADDKPEGEAVELSESNKWTYTWSKLAAKKAGKDITYTVKETSELPEGYTSEVSGSAKEGFTITNSHTPETIEISGTKTWDDNNNQDGARPDSITVRLKADGVEKDSRIVTAKEDWKYSFTRLPKYKAGNEISYSVTEDKVEGYKTTINGTNITNSYKKAEVTLAGIKILKGRSLKNKEFAFELKDSKDNVLSTAYNNAEGTFTFDPITYTQEDLLNEDGTYASSKSFKYSVTEKNDGKTYITYDKTKFEVTVTLSSNEDGSLSTAVEYKKSGSDKVVDRIAFENTYSSTGKITFSGKKKLAGAAPEEGIFTFKVVDGFNDRICEVKNKADGSIAYPEFEYSLDDVGKTHTYTISEEKGTADSIQYDETVYTIHVEIKDNGDGTLAVTAKDADKKDITSKTNVGYEVTGLDFDNSLKILVSKVDATTGKEVEGATIQILNQDGKVVDKWTSDGTSHDFGSKLEAGKTYTFHEDGAPAGYAYINDVKITVKKDGSVETDLKKDKQGNYLIEDEQLSLKFEKTDADGKMLKGAQFTLTDKTDNKTVKTFTTQGNVVELGSELIAGHTYILTEIDAPDGYKKAPDIIFTVSKDGTITSGNKTITKITVVDEKAGKKTPSTPSKSDHSAKTGDNTPISDYMVLMLACAGLAVALFLRRRQEAEKE